MFQTKCQNGPEGGGGSAHKLKNPIMAALEQRSFRCINSYASRTLAVFPDECPAKPVNIPPKSIINPVPVNGEYFITAPPVGPREATRY